MVSMHIINTRQTLSKAFENMYKALYESRKKKIIGCMLINISHFQHEPSFSHALSSHHIVDPKRHLVSWVKPSGGHKTHMWTRAVPSPARATSLKSLPDQNNDFEAEKMENPSLSKEIKPADEGPKLYVFVISKWERSDCLFALVHLPS